MQVDLAFIAPCHIMRSEVIPLDFFGEPDVSPKSNRTHSVPHKPSTNGKLPTSY